MTFVPCWIGGSCAGSIRLCFTVGRIPIDIAGIPTEIWFRKMILPMGCRQRRGSAFQQVAGEITKHTIRINTCNKCMFCSISPNFDCFLSLVHPFCWDGLSKKRREENMLKSIEWLVTDVRDAWHSALKG